MKQIFNIRSVISDNFFDVINMFIDVYNDIIIMLLFY